MPPFGCDLCGPICMYMCACEKQGSNQGIRVLLCFFFLTSLLAAVISQPFSDFCSGAVLLNDDLCG